MTNTTETLEKLSFGADVSRLLDIVAHALYANRDVFLRELVSNAADACDRLRYQAIAKPALTAGASDFRIRIRREPSFRHLVVADNGIGMNRDELVKNLGTIAWSGTAKVMEELGKAATKEEKMNLIGQFGVGFYASFMVSDQVRVVSRAAGTKETWLWESDGRTGFGVRAATPEECAYIEDGRGTAVILKINDDASEYLLDAKLKEIIETYSDHISVPIFLGEDKDKPVNNGTALWMRSKNTITETQYTEFYRHIGHGMDEPLMTSHWHAEGKIEYTALLFIPTMRPWDLYDPTRKSSTRLYVKRVFITDHAEGLMYSWLRFVRGVIDSEDLPLNVSREMLQHNPVIDKIRMGVGKRILTDLDRLAHEDEMAFGTFWGQFGAVLKEGLYDATAHREDLLKVVRFYSTHEDGKLVSLADYKARMKPEQEDIYYISGESIETLRNSPQIEGFRARGLEVLFFTDTIDDFWLQNVPDYEGKSFKSVTKGHVDLSKFRQPGDEADKKTDPAAWEKDEGLRRLKAIIEETLKEEIGAVRYSDRLIESPVCLVAADNEVDLRMERVLRIHQKYNPHSLRELEVNPEHPLIRRLSGMAAQGPTGETLADAAHLLLDQARIIQGEPVPNPAAFARRLAQFMERGMAA